MNFVLILCIAPTWADGEKKTQNMSGPVWKGCNTLLKQELGRLLNIFCSCGHFPCGLGFLCAPGEMFYCTWALGVSILTLEPWGSFLDVQEEATGFFKTKTWNSSEFSYVWTENSEQITNSVFTFDNSCFTWRCVGERPRGPNVHSDKHPDWLCWHFLSFTVLADAK